MKKVITFLLLILLPCISSIAYNDWDTIGNINILEIDKKLEVLESSYTSKKDDLKWVFDSFVFKKTPDIFDNVNIKSIKKLLLDRKIKIFFPLVMGLPLDLENNDNPELNPQDRLDAIDSLIKYYKTPYTSEEINKTMSNSIKMKLNAPEEGRYKMKMRYVNNKYFIPVYIPRDWEYKYIAKYNILDRSYYPFKFSIFGHECKFHKKYIKSEHGYNDEKLFLIERQDEISCYLDKGENNLEFRLNQFQKNGFKLKKFDVEE